MSGASSTKLKAALFLAGGVTVGAVGAGYVIKDDNGRPFLQSLVSSDSMVEQQTSEAPSIDKVTEKADEPEAPKVAALSETVDPEKEVKTEPAIEPETVQPPSFDLLRVERDGSVVIAGRAPSNSFVEILGGTEILATGKAGPDGDFAIVFDEQLAPGAHELTIRATPEPQDGEDPAPILSAETGVVTVPEMDNAQDEVLAMVQQPGAATRVLQVPEAEPVSEQAGEVETPTQEPQETETTQPVEEETEVAETEVVESEEETTEVAESEQPKLEADEAKVEPAIETVEAEPVDDVEPSVAKEPATAEAVSQEPEESVNVAVATPLSVQAVDVEPNRVFIAGAGEPGSKVQVYIDSEFKGVAKIGPQGGFLFEMSDSLAAGRHDLRIDQIDSTGAVASRVAVVVDHEVEETLADASEPIKPAPEPVAESPKEPVVEPAEDVAEVKDPVQETVTATASESVQVAEAKEEAPTETAQVAEAPEAPEVPEVPEAPEASEVTKPAEVVEEKQPEEVEKVEIASAEPVAEPEVQPIETAEPQEPDVKVIKTGKSVIIRRGDNLWRISRRMLGQGRRYTMIFEANANVIKDPNIIFPGQVFDVPDQAEIEGDEQQG